MVRTGLIRSEGAGTSISRTPLKNGVGSGLLSASFGTGVGGTLLGISLCVGDALRAAVCTALGTSIGMGGTRLSTSIGVCSTLGTCWF